MYIPTIPEGRHLGKEKNGRPERPATRHPRRAAPLGFASPAKEGLLLGDSPIPQQQGTSSGWQGLGELHWMFFVCLFVFLKLGCFFSLDFKRFLDVFGLGFVCLDCT